MHLHTKKQQQYFNEVIRIHYEYGYGEDRISRILPIGHSTVSRWISIFASENAAKAVKMKKKKLLKVIKSSTSEVSDLKFLQSEVIRLQSQLKQESLRADAYDELINVAETRFNIAIRKKVGAKR